MITDLENQKCLKITPSQNFLCLDNRKFILNENIAKIVPILSDYINISYEVDSLGTKFFKTLSSGIKLLWERYFKV